MFPKFRSVNCFQTKRVLAQLLKADDTYISIISINLITYYVEFNNFYIGTVNAVQKKFVCTKW